MGIQVADKTKWISKSKENVTWSEKDTIFFLFNKESLKRGIWIIMQHFEYKTSTVTVSLG